ncbi:MAG TPA: N-acetyltransferase [Dehalococcoidales bacterium]|nr:N-acetyltransferase [Dehalococcoidales bacterium]
MKIEKAKISDVPLMHKLINHFAEKDEMLPRSLSELYENMRDCFVVKDGDKLLGCVALHVFWSDLAEVRSLAVAEDSRDKGIGVELVKACMQESKELGIATVFCLTYRPDLFKKFDFKQVDKMELPRKVWTECYRCPKFPDCDEVALIYEMEA